MPNVQSVQAEQTLLFDGAQLVDAYVSPVQVVQALQLRLLVGVQAVLSKKPVAQTDGKHAAQIRLLVPLQALVS